MEKYYIWLLLAFGESEPMVSELITRFGTAEKAYRAFEKNVALVGPELTAKASGTDLSKAQKVYENLLASGYGVITWESPDYPERLRRVTEPPCVLFTLGDTSLLRKKLITIVGARDIKDPTAAAIPQIISQLGYEYAVVSSLSEGCDQLTCMNALSMRVPFIEILPCGFAQTYPTGSRTLRRFLLASGGLLMTEFLPKTKSSPGSFIRRSRIIGGISKVTLVLQAGDNSGSLATAEYSAAPLFLPPYDSSKPEYAGSINAMRSGAKPYLGHYSIEKAFARVEEKETADAAAAAEAARRPKFRKRAGKDKKPVPDMIKAPAEKPAKAPKDTMKAAPAAEAAPVTKAAPVNDGERGTVYELIASSKTPITVEELLARTNIPPARLTEILLDMEIDGIVTCAGTRYTAL